MVIPPFFGSIRTKMIQMDAKPIPEPNGLGIPNSVQKIVTGAIIIAAVALDQMRHRRAES